MSKLPALMFVVDPNKEHIAVAEARTLEIPVMAITDTNCNPDKIDYVIPGNDDAIRAIRLFAGRVADACVIGSKLFKERGARSVKEDEVVKEHVIHVQSGGDGPTVRDRPGRQHPDPGSVGNPRRVVTTATGARKIMANVSAAQIKELRERTGAGMADCKKALVECSTDMEKAIEFLRKKGLAKAAKKSGRIAAEGLITQYIHGTGRIGVLLETNCETDFVARNEDFIGFTREVCLQIAAMNPQYVSREEVSDDVIAKEREIRSATAKEGGKPDNIVAKIVDGQISKWLKEICLPRPAVGEG